MKNLVIIGNGFDIAHGMPTSYLDFRHYLCGKYDIDPDIEEQVTPIPEPTELPDGGEKYDNNEVGSYLVEEIDIAGGDKWGDLETCLGREIFFYLRDELRESDIDDKDNEIGNDADVNTQLVSHLIYVFDELRKLFNSWVHEELSLLPAGYRKDPVIADAIRKLDDSLFLSFNYTYTLEKLYGVKNVLHIHGTVDSDDDDILFGHNIEESVVDELFLHYYGVEDIDSIQTFLHKDTKVAIWSNGKFFKNIDSVTDIYSYGFSFSEPDKEYLDEIERHIDPARTTWHLNEYDSANDEYIKLLKERGYIVDTENHIW